MYVVRVIGKKLVIIYTIVVLKMQVTTVCIPCLTIVKLSF